MPELPEVETIRRGLSRLITGKRIQGVVSDSVRSFPNEPKRIKQHLIGSTITRIDRQGKALLLGLDSGYVLAGHLKMTGQLVYEAPQIHFGAGHPTTSLIGKLPDKSTRVTFTFSDGTRLYFNDQRKFGWLKLLTQQELANDAFFANLGPDALDSHLTWQQFKDRLQKHARLPIKSALMNQTIIAGIGNIYADESLWGAKIHPAQPAGLLTNHQYQTLLRAIREILQISLDKGGSTDRNYVNAEGKPGGYLDFARVFRRQNQPCPRCQATIRKIKLGGRGTHYCPRCQALRLKQTV